MDCKEFRRLIWEELDGALEGARLAQFSEHRQKCAACEREYLKQRRIKLYMQCFPTISGVSDRFRRELMTRVRNGDLRSHYRLNYPRITATLALFAVIFVGLLFAVNSYREYMVTEKGFIARYPEGPEAVQSVYLPGLGRELGVSEDQPVYALALPNLRAEDFVVKLLANYENGEVAERLVNRLAVETGLLDGVSMHPSAQGSSGRTVVTFPRALPPLVIAYVGRRDLIDLRRFTLDVINTYGPRVTSSGSAPVASLDFGPALPINDGELEIVDVGGGTFNENLVPDGVVPLIITFKGAQLTSAPGGGN
ncbi:zf-HC2 domain-containing protein [bacterium]|nr:zf-HC2 domain-containing protein [bacterium]